MVGISEVVADTFTIFSVPRIWKGKPDVEQRNAVGSWLRLRPRPEIILFGDDEGTGSAAEEYGCCWVSGLPCNEHGTPFIDSVFHLAQEWATRDLMAFVNADIILMQGWADALMACALKFEQFCMVGQRQDIALYQPMPFQEGWQAQLEGWARTYGTYFTPAGSDYFGFRRGLYPEVPPFLIGRSAWDNWLMAYPPTAGVPLVDATPAACIVHPETRTSKVSEWVRHQPHVDEERRYNKELMAGIYGLSAGRVTDAQWQVTAAGEVNER